MVGERYFVENPTTTKKYVPVDRFPSIAEKLSDNIEVWYFAETIDQLRDTLGATSCTLEKNSGELVCQVPSERWSLLKDSLRAFTHTTHLPVTNTPLGCHAKVEYVTVVPNGDIVEVRITYDLNDVFSVGGRDCSFVRLWGEHY